MADAQNNQKNQQQDLNQILKVRREKLAALDNETLAAYCRFANAAGSSCASRPGGIPALPTEEQVKEVIEKFPLLVRNFQLN